MKKPVYLCSIPPAYQTAMMIYLFKHNHTLHKVTPFLISIDVNHATWMNTEKQWKLL